MGDSTSWYVPCVLCNTQWLSKKVSKKGVADM